MKSIVLSSTIAVSCAVLASAAPTNLAGSEVVLEARMKKIAEAAGKAAEKWALNPQSMTDRDQRAQNRNNAIQLATSKVTGVKPPGPARQQHPELAATMNKIKNANTAANAFASKKYGSSSGGTKKRSIDDSEIVLEARMKKIAEAAGKAAEKWALNPQSMTDRDQRAQNRNNAIQLATSKVTGVKPPGPARQQHPELAATMNKIKNANTAANAFASKKYGSSSGTKKRSIDDSEVVLEARMKKIAEAAGKAAEKWALNPQSMTDRDQRAQNRNNAIQLATSKITGVKPPGPARQQHPELAATLNKIKNANTAANAFASKKYGSSSGTKKRSIDDDGFDLQARSYYDYELEDLD